MLCSPDRSPIIILTAFTFDILIICVTSHDHCTVAISSISWTSPDSMMPSLSCLCWFFRRNKQNNYCVIITTTAPQKTGINKQFTLDDLFPNNSVYHLSPGIRQALPVTSGSSSHVKSQTRIKWWQTNYKTYTLSPQWWGCGPRDLALTPMNTPGCPWAEDIPGNCTKLTIIF